MKAIIRQFGGAAIAAVVAVLLMLVVVNVPVDGESGVSYAVGAAVGDEEGVLAGETTAAFDAAWRKR